MAPNPAYSSYLGFAPTFNYYGRSWGASDQDAFFKALRKHGVNINAWIKNHPTANKVFSPIEQLLYANIQPQIHAIQEAEKQKQDFLHRQLMDIGGFYNALQGTLSGIGPYVGGQYKQGANTMGAAGEGYGAVLNQTQAANAAGQNATLEALNSPARTEGGDAGSVLSGLAGWIPQSMLDTQGPAYASALATLPASASLEAQIMAKGILEQAQQSQTDTQNSIMDIITGAPALRQQYQSQFQGDWLNNQKLKLARLQEQHDHYRDMAAIAAANHDRKTRDKYLKLAEQKQRQAELEAQGYDSNGYLLPEYYLDKNGYVVPRGYRYNSKGELVSTSGSNKAPRGVDWGKLQQQMANEKLTKEVPDDSFTADPGDTKTVTMTYQEAYKVLMSEYGGYVKDKKKLAQIIRKILAAKGIKKSSPPPYTGH